MKITILEPVTLRCELLPAGAEIETDDLTARQLIAAGQAVAVDHPKPQKSPKE